jgi:hypothetical protein
MIKIFVVNPLLYINTSPNKYSQSFSLFISNKLSLIKSLILSKTSSKKMSSSFENEYEVNQNTRR